MTEKTEVARVRRTGKKPSISSRSVDTAAHKRQNTDSDRFNIVSDRVWRPLREVQVKVIGICINRKQLLAMEVYDDRGEIKGVRPLGGHIEFGETREIALVREYREELNTDIVTAGSWRTFENIYTHEGELGHEYIHAISIALVDKSLYTQPVIAFSEDTGTECRARWFDIRQLRRGEIPLFPDGLADTL